MDLQQNFSKTIVNSHHYFYIFRERVGVMLLKKMGWKPGQGIGPRLTKKEKKQKSKHQEKVKVYGCSLPDQEQKVPVSQSDSSDDEDYVNLTFAPDDYEPFRYFYKLY